MAELRRTDPVDKDLETVHAWGAVKKILGPAEYEVAREEARAEGHAYWGTWLPTMWRRVDELGLREEAVAAVAEANERAGWWDGAQHAPLLRPVD